MIIHIAQQLLLVLLAGGIMPVQPAYAETITAKIALVRTVDPTTNIQPIDAATPDHRLPEIQYKPKFRTLAGHLFAYSSTPSQTNGDPFITASGTRVTDGIVANNCLPFGTEIRIPNLFGDKVFRVQDRMAARYGCESFDIWFSSTADAIQFGKRTATVQVY